MTITDENLAEIKAGLVRSLVWRDLSAPNDPEFLAHHCYGSYTIRFDPTCMLPWIVKPFPCSGSNFASLPEAQEAAEVEHKSRMARDLDPSSLLARLERAEAERDEAKKVASQCSNELIVWRAAFQSVTPGGSEFASPAAVKQWAHMLKMQAYDANKKAVLSERRTLAAESTLSKRVEDLEAALEPFSEVLNDYDPDAEEDETPGTFTAGSVTNYDLTLGDFRRARALTGGSDG